MDREGGDVAADLLIQALSHSRRLELLALLERQDATASMLRSWVDDLELNTVVYHLTVLLEAGCVELVETRPVDGTFERVYRARPDLFLDPLYRSHAGLAEVEEESVLNWTGIKVDEVGWDQVVDLLQAARSQLLAVEEQSRQRLSLLDEEGITLTVGVAALRPQGRPRWARR
jgi:DNA-binding transcriptional ArsR family regulator